MKQKILWARGTDACACEPGESSKNRTSVLLQICLVHKQMLNSKLLKFAMLTGTHSDQAHNYYPLSALDVLTVRSV